MKKFLDYWDDVLAQWCVTFEMPEQEAHWAEQKDTIGLQPEMIPMPYLGNPWSSSAVVINYNPGAADYPDTPEGQEAKLHDTEYCGNIDNPESVVGYFARNFRERMLAGDYFGFPVKNTTGIIRTEAGQNWWKQRKKWIKELIPESNKNPFAFELCGWHSKDWKKVELDDKLLSKLKELMASALDEAIAASDLGIGLSVGKIWGTKILPAFGYNDVTADVMDLPAYDNDWKPLNNNARGFRILKNDKGTFIINTWASSMMTPGPDFRAIEQDMLARIRKAKEKIIINLS